MSKHPELKGVVLAYGVSYACAYMRLENGWDLARAVNTPVHKRVPTERTIWNAKARAERRVAKRHLTPRVVATGNIRPGRGHYTRHVEDTSPAHIRKLRARFCDHFIKTGEIDQALQQKLKDYADEHRAANDHSQRVPNEQETRRYSGRETGVGDHGDRSSAQVDERTAERIDYLRS